MVGILGKAPLASDLAFFIEIGIVISLFISRFLFAKKKRFRAHGASMTAAVGLHALTILLVMIPSFAKFLSFLLGNPSNPVAIITWIHAPLGLTALILGIYLVSTWKFQTSTDTCLKNAKIMKPLWLLWILTLTLGIILYLILALYGTK